MSRAILHERHSCGQIPNYPKPTLISRRVFWGCSCAVCFAAIAALTNPFAGLLAMCSLALLVVMALVDDAEKIAPFELAYMLYAFALIYAFTKGSYIGAISSLVLALATRLIIELGQTPARIRKTPLPIGGGDVRVLPACALLVGTQGLLTFLLVVGLAPLVALAAARLTGRDIDMKSRIPMCPFFALACMAGVLAGLT